MDNNFNIYHDSIVKIIIKENGRPIPFDVLKRKLMNQFNLKDYLTYTRVTKIMVDDNELKQLPSGSFVPKHLIVNELASNEIIQGTVKIQSNFNASVFLENDKETRFFIAKRNLHGALNGDVVQIQKLKMPIFPNSRPNTFIDAKIINIVSHKKNCFTGTFKQTELNNYQIVVDDPKFYYTARLNNTNGLVNGTKFLFEVMKYDDNYAYSTIKQIFGHENDVGSDILAAVYDNGIEPEFSPEILDIANKLKIEWDPNHPDNRKDLTNDNFITIDPASSKDFDDSFYLKKLDNGNYLLNVAIADVGHFVKYGSKLAQEALKRGTSIYLTDRVIPMYPHIISDDLCSLNPNVIRFSVNCEMEIDNNGQFQKINVYKAAIKSKRRFSYDEVNDYFDHKDLLNNDQNAIKTMLHQAFELHQILRTKKKNDGYIDFNIKEPIIVVDENGFPIDIKIYQTGEAQKMIEDFMIAANEAVTIFAINHKLPFIYRIHDEPDPVKMQEFSKLVNRIDFKSILDLNDLTSKKIANWLEVNKDHKNIDIARKVLLQSMSKAIYYEEQKPHFGISSNTYTHFTSPIRRFPDTLVSQLFHMYIFDKEQYTDKQRNDIANDIKMFAALSSEREVIATKLGFDVNEMKFAEYMTKHIGQRYIGMITSINNFGAFVQLENTVEGLMHIKNLKTDFFSYDQATSTLIGKNTRIELHVGDKVEVEVIGADKQTRKIDFDLVKKIEE